MAIDIFGKSSICKTIFVGRAAMGIAAETDLSVNAATDLAIDALADLAVSEGVTWFGATSIRSIPCEGAAAALPQTDP